MSMVLSTGKELTDTEVLEAYYKQDKKFSLEDLATVLEDMDRSLDEFSDEQKAKMLELFEEYKDNNDWRKAAESAIRVILAEKVRRM